MVRNFREDYRKLQKAGPFNNHASQRSRFRGGRIPFGYRVDDGAFEVEDQQVAIRDMLSMTGKGASLRAISDAMKARGLSVSHNAVREITARAKEV